MAEIRKVTFPSSSDSQLIRTLFASYSSDTLAFHITNRLFPTSKVSPSDRCPFSSSQWTNVSPRIRKRGNGWPKSIVSTQLLLTMARGSSSVGPSSCSIESRSSSGSIRFRSRSNIRWPGWSEQGARIRLEHGSRDQPKLFGMFRSIEKDENHSLRREQVASLNLFGW